jgi:hypothetical protein
MHSYKIGFVLRKQWRARLVPAIFFRLAINCRLSVGVSGGTKNSLKYVIYYLKLFI